MGGRGSASPGNHNQETVLAQLTSYLLQPVEPLLSDIRDIEAANFGATSPLEMEEVFSREAELSGTFDPSSQIVSVEQDHTVTSPPTPTMTPSVLRNIEVSQNSSAVSGQSEESRTGRNSRYVVIDEETGQLMLAPEYRVTTTRQRRREPGEPYRPVLRSRFYGTRYHRQVVLWKEERLRTPFGQTTPSGYNGLRHPHEPNQYWWNGEWWLDEGDTAATVDHSDMPVVTHWNTKGNNQSQAQRLEWVSSLTNLDIVPWSMNSSNGARQQRNVTFTFQVGENFSGPGESRSTRATRIRNRAGQNQTEQQGDLGRSETSNRPRRKRIRARQPEQG